MLDVRFSADYVRFSPRSGRIDTVTVESARDPNRTSRDSNGIIGKRTRTAIMMFQAKQGIRIDGEVTDDLIRRLTRAVAAKQ